jgi:hypothetical protein
MNAVVVEAYRLEIGGFGEEGVGGIALGEIRDWVSPAIELSEIGVLLGSYTKGTFAWE